MPDYVGVVSQPAAGPTLGMLNSPSAFPSVQTRALVPALAQAVTTSRTYTGSILTAKKAHTLTLVPFIQPTWTRTRSVTVGMKEVEPDWPTRTGGKAITGIIYGIGNVRVPFATVKLVRQQDDRVVRTLITDENGNYVFVRGLDDPYTYYVMAYIEGSTPQIHGISDRGQAPK